MRDRLIILVFFFLLSFLTVEEANEVSGRRCPRCRQKLNKSFKGEIVRLKGEVSSLRQKDTQLMNKDAQLMDKDQELMDKDGQLMMTDDRLEQKTQQLMAKDSEIMQSLRTITMTLTNANEAIKDLTMALSDVSDSVANNTAKLDMAHEAIKNLTLKANQKSAFDVITNGSDIVEGSLIDFLEKNADIADDFDLGNDCYTTPCTGHYHFSLDLTCGGNFVNIILVIGGNEIPDTNLFTFSDNGVSANVIREIEAGVKVAVKALVTPPLGGGFVRFTGKLVHCEH